jgi:hypothetical protein
MLYQAVIRTPWYDIGGRKYLDLEFEGLVRTVKVPFRYRRVMCHVEGLVPIQEMPVGSVLDCILERKVWNGETFWVLHSVTTCRLPTRMVVST